MHRAIDELNERHGIPTMATVRAGRGGLPMVRITAPNAVGEIYLHGGHVTSWIPEGEPEVLFLCRQSRFEPGRAIRGGIPICFPWFGTDPKNPAAPAHGFVRTKSWQLDSIEARDSAVTVQMSITTDDESRKWSAEAAFRVVHEVTFGRTLKSELHVYNRGTTPFTFEAALHSYYRVSDVRNIMVEGLDSAEYLDKVDGGHQKQQQGTISIAGETDRVYLHTQHPIVISDLGLSRRIAIQKENSSNTVVWNPWTEKARALADLGDDEWTMMMCVEVANVGNEAITLSPGETHRTCSVSECLPL